MSGRVWKPGDVAVMESQGGPLRIFCYRDLNEGTVEWMSVDEGGAYPGEMFPARPLVVIDPEDGEQVTRLLESLGADFYYGTHGMLTASLRSLIEPPKPEEPTGLGAIVEEADGKTWVRVVRTDSHPWQSSDNAIGSCRAPWSGFDAVTVIHEGVS